MAKEPSKTHLDSGLELDKINLPNISSRDESGPKPAQNPVAGGTHRKPAPESMPQNEKKTNLALFSVLAVLVLLMALTAFFKQPNYTFKFLSGESDAPYENYLRVGPVTATLANEDIVKFSIDIDCGSDDLKEQLAGKDTQIRDKIVAVLTAPGTEELIKKREYEAIKAKIKESLDGLGSESINDIYFHELLTY